MRKNINVEPLELTSRYHLPLAEQIAPIRLENVMWTVASKILPVIIASSAITAIIIKYFFERRLEKYKSQLKVYEQFLSSLVTALNLLINDYKLIVLKAKSIGSELESGHLESKSIDELRNLRQQYQNTLRANRVYLSRLIPYGTTDSFVIRYDDIKFAAAGYLLELLVLMHNEQNQQKIEKYGKAVPKAIHYVNLSYESVCQKMNAIIEQMHQGRNPFTIRWSDLECGGWLDTVEAMHFEMSWLEFAETSND